MAFSETFTTRDKNILGKYGYGFSDEEIQQLQDAGIGRSNIMSLGLNTTPQTTTAGYLTGQQGNPQVSTSAFGNQQNQNAALLRTIMKLGGGTQQKAPPPPPTSQELAQNPLYNATALGAAALNMPMVINPTPGE